MHKKPFLPEKICPVCGQPFAWRKKWRNNWDTVVYCSERCQRNRQRSPRAVTPLSGDQCATLITS